MRTPSRALRRQGLVARVIRRSSGFTRQDKTAPKFPDLLKRDFTAKAANVRWVGDMKKIKTGEGDLYLGTVIDLYSRRALAVATSTSPNAQLACDAIKMAVAVRGGADQIAGVVFHTDRCSTYTAGSFTSLCSGLKIRQSTGRLGSASITLLRRRGSPPWSGSSCGTARSRLATRPLARSAAGRMSSTTADAATARSACLHPSATSNPLPFRTSPPNDEPSTGAGGVLKWATAG